MLLISSSVRSRSASDSSSSGASNVITWFGAAEAAAGAASSATRQTRYGSSRGIGIPNPSEAAPLRWCRNRISARGEGDDAHQGYEDAAGLRTRQPLLQHD